MSRTASELSGNGSSEFTRRTFLFGAMGVAGIALVGGGVKKFAPNHQSSLDSSFAEGAISNHLESVAKAVTIEQSRANIEGLVQSSDLYSDGVDPHILLNRSYEEIVRIGGVKITSENKSNTGILAHDTVDAVKLFLRAGNTGPDLINEMSQDNPIPIGVRNDRGSTVTSMYNGPDGHAEFVNEHYGIPLLEGMCPDEYDGVNIVPVKKALLGLQHFTANVFEINATKQIGVDAEGPTLNTAVHPELRGFEELSVVDGRFPHLKNARRLTIVFDTTRTDDPKPFETSLTVTCVEDEPRGKYLMLFENYTGAV